VQLTKTTTTIHIELGLPIKFSIKILIRRLETIHLIIKEKTEDHSMLRIIGKKAYHKRQVLTAGAI